MRNEVLKGDSISIVECPKCPLQLYCTSAGMIFTRYKRNYPKLISYNSYS